MKRSLTKLAVVVVCLGLVCSFSFAETEDKESNKAGAQRKNEKMRKMLCKKLKEQNSQNKQKEPKKISVQLFVVQAEMNALYKEGVNPLGADTKVSVGNIIACIQKDKASVVSGISVSANEKEEAREHYTKQFFIEYGSAKQRRSRSYTREKSLNINPFVTESDKIRVQLSYLETNFDVDNTKEDRQTPPANNERSLRTSIMLTPGKPEVISGFQKEDEGEFIIIAADIIE